MPINAEWHRKHPMPPRASMAQRMRWHVAHAKHCGCRPIPATVRAHIAAAKRTKRAKKIRRR